jgi:hypothetical protein
MTLFPAYVQWWNTVANQCVTTLSSALILTFLCATLIGTRFFLSSEAGRKLTFLGVAGILLIYGLYYLQSSHPVRPAILYVSMGLLVFYAATWGLAQGERANGFTRVDVGAVAIVLLSTTIKLTDLETWPPLLTDYAASTGVDTIIGSHALRGYLSGGGSSPLHGPLLRILFSIFGYGTYAVRLAEVVASVIALTVLWTVLRKVVSSWWSLATLTLFAFSSEHLSQSRMGTFYSVSQALSLATLSLWLFLKDSPSRRKTYLGFIGLATLVTPWGYAPTRAILALSAQQLIELVVWNRLTKTTLAACTVVFLVILTGGYYFIYQEPHFKHFGGPRFVPATDSPVWYRTVDGEVSYSLQSLSTIGLNIIQNLGVMVDRAVHPPSTSEQMYGFWMPVLAALATLGALSNRWKTISLYIVIGCAPSLLTFPIERRGVMIRPFIPMVLVMYVREFFTTLRQLISQSYLRGVFHLIIVGALLVLPLQGVYLLAKTNGVVGVGPSFGPEYAKDLIDHLVSLSKKRPIVVLNAGKGIDKFKMGLANELYGADRGRYRINFTTLQPDTSARILLEVPRPVSFAVLSENHRNWIIPWLKGNIPELKLHEYQKSGVTMFWIADLD